MTCEYAVEVKNLKPGEQLVLFCRICNKPVRYVK